MKVSFVIPAYNEEAYLPDCLTSVLAETNETPVDSEIIVVNNASTDNTKVVAQRFSGVIVVDEPRKGLVFARAGGFVASTGDLIANVDSDTRLPKGWLTTVVSEFEKDSELAALSGPFIYYDLSKFSRALVFVFYSFGYALHRISLFFSGKGAMLQGGNFIVTRKALEEIGGYDTTIAFYGEDTDVARRISKIGKVKWTFALPMYASGRRLKGEGILTMGFKYALNYASTSFFGKPATQKYTDIRSDTPS